MNSSISDPMSAFLFAKKHDTKGFTNSFPRYNGAPRQDAPIIIDDIERWTPEFAIATWELIPSWLMDRGNGGRPPSGYTIGIRRAHVV